MLKLSLKFKKALIFLIIAYSLEYQYISAIVDCALVTSSQSYGEINVMKRVIPDDKIYRRFSFTNKPWGSNYTIFQLYDIHAFVVLHWFTGAKVFYIYNNNYIESDYLYYPYVCGSIFIPVTVDIKLTGKGLTVTHYHEDL